MKLGLVLLALAGSWAAQGQVVALKAARMFDGKGDAVRTPGLVVVEGGKIRSVGGSVPEGATVIDLGDATLLPGFMDAHTHLTGDFNPDYVSEEIDTLQRPIPEQALISGTYGVRH